MTDTAGLPRVPDDEPENPPDTSRWLTARQIRAISWDLAYDLDRLRNAGHVTAVKVGTLWRYDPASVNRARAESLGVRDLEAAARQIAELRGEVERLDRMLREEGQRLVSDAEEALRLLEPERIVEILREVIEAERGRTAREAYVLMEAAERIADRPYVAEAVGQRPKYIGKNAKRRWISTSVGRIDIWYWTTAKGLYCATFGGPRPAQGRWTGETIMAAVKVAGRMARMQYGKPTRRTGQRLRFAILKRDGFACHYCGRKPPEVELHVDHVIPVADGGTDDPANLVAACFDCNAGKSDT